MTAKHNLAIIEPVREEAQMTTRFAAYSGGLAVSLAVHTLWIWGVATSIALLP